MKRIGVFPWLVSATQVLERLLVLNRRVSNIVWGPQFLVLLLGTGLYLTVRLGLPQVFRLRHAWRVTFGSLGGGPGRGRGRGRGTGPGSGQAPLPAFHAVSAAMAATVGVGNIAGVGTAIALGGPGAVFWMWMSGVVGMATKLCEALLAVKFRQADGEEVAGGAMFYIRNGLGRRWRPLALAWSVLVAVAALGVGNMVQANSVAETLRSAFGVKPAVSGLATAVFAGFVILGGIRKIGAAASLLVPAMAAIYAAGSLASLAVCAHRLPAALVSIFTGAFTPAAAAGGFTGAGVAAAVRYGVARGVFSNEAGLGSASLAHAQSRADPATQGMWGMWEVLIDTLVVASLTALVILSADVLGSGRSGASLAQLALEKTLGGPGRLVIPVVLPLFAFSTILTWSFYGEQGLKFLAGPRLAARSRKAVELAYRSVFLFLTVIGAVGGLEAVWRLSDTLNGLMAAPNLIALLLLAPVAAAELRRAHRPPPGSAGARPGPREEIP